MNFVLRGVVAACFMLLSGHGWSAESMGFENEELVTTKATVVDLACELTKDCPAQCGAGKRQLGLRTDKGRLLVAAKGQADFFGVIPDLIGQCGREIWVDGLAISKFNATVFIVQGWRLGDTGAFTPTDRSLTEWAAAHKVKPDSEIAQNWVRNDETVKAAVARRGRAGVPE